MIEFIGNKVICFYFEQFKCPFRYCRAFYKGLPSFILASPKTNQKASAWFLADLSAACRLKQTYGYRPVCFFTAFSGQVTRLRHRCTSGWRTTSFLPEGFASFTCKADTRKAKIGVKKQTLSRQGQIGLV